VDCGTPIIGERLRCPACHDRHAVGFLAGDEDVTLPRKRSSRSSSFWRAVFGLFARFFIALFVVIVVILLALVGKGCS
jgi:uncharacterized membrane protein YdfJ with MMPL/SSD domain